MQKRKQLIILDRKLNHYYSIHNYAKKQIIQAYSTRKEDITKFYATMKDHLYHNHLQNQMQAHNKTHFRHHSSKNNSKFSDRMFFSLPKQIYQKNTISTVDAQSMKMSQHPMYSQVQSNKKMRKYLISKDIRRMIVEDIKNLQIQKQQKEFSQLKRSTSQQIIRKQKDNIFSAQSSIEKFNKILLKYNEKFIRPEQNVQESSQQLVDTINYNFINLMQQLFYENKKKQQKREKYDFIVNGAKKNFVEMSVDRNRLAFGINQNENGMKTVRKDHRRQSFMKGTSSVFITEEKRSRHLGLKTSTESLFKSLPKPNIRIVSSMVSKKSISKASIGQNLSSKQVKHRFKSSSEHQKPIVNVKTLKTLKISLNKVPSLKQMYRSDSKALPFTFNRTTNQIKERILRAEIKKQEGKFFEGPKFRTKTITHTLKLKL